MEWVISCRNISETLDSLYFVDWKVTLSIIGVFNGKNHSKTATNEKKKVLPLPRQRTVSQIIGYAGSIALIGLRNCFYIQQICRIQLVSAIWMFLWLKKFFKRNRFSLVLTRFLRSESFYVEMLENLIVFRQLESIPLM